VFFAPNFLSLYKEGEAKRLVKYSPLSNNYSKTIWKSFSFTFTLWI